MPLSISYEKVRNVERVMLCGSQDMFSVAVNECDVYSVVTGSPKLLRIGVKLSSFPAKKAKHNLARQGFEYSRTPCVDCSVQSAPMLI